MIPKLWSALFGVTPVPGFSCAHAHTEWFTGSIITHTKICEFANTANCFTSYLHYHRSHDNSKDDGRVGQLRSQVEEASIATARAYTLC